MNAPQHVLFAPDAPYAPLSASRPEVLAVAVSLAHVTKIGWPTKQMVRWLDVLMPSYSQHPSYWWPHEVSGSGVVYTKSWARGGFGYFSSLGGIANPESVASVDPLDWHSGLASRLANVSMSEDVRIACDLMCEQCDPNDALFGKLVMGHLQEVRSAMEQKKLIVDPSKIRRILRKIA